MQLTLDSLFKTEFKIDKPIRLIELFAGVGSQAMALRNIGADFEHYRVVEFDKYPIASCNAIHGTNFEPMDITQTKGEDLGVVDTDCFTYLLTYSFPCTDLSLAGKQAGMSKGSGTRSGLLWEVERLLTECYQLSNNINANYGMPQILVMENVPQVHSEKNRADFEQWLKFLQNMGYESYWQDMNAKNYGTPQNRNRCFCVSLLGNYNFEFPKEKPLGTTMNDYLEEKVDEKYYLKSERAKKLIDQVVVDNPNLFALL